MPPKVKQLIKKLEKAGFVGQSGKGSHRKFKHPKGQVVIISGKTGSDAKPYQIKETDNKIKESEQ